MSRGLGRYPFFFFFFSPVLSLFGQVAQQKKTDFGVNILDYLFLITDTLFFPFLIASHGVFVIFIFFVTP